MRWPRKRKKRYTLLFFFSAIFIGKNLFALKETYFTMTSIFFFESSFKLLKMPLMTQNYLVSPRAEFQYALLTIKWKVLYVYWACTGERSRTEPTAAPITWQNHRSLVFISTTAEFIICAANDENTFKSSFQRDWGFWQVSTNLLYKTISGIQTKDASSLTVWIWS